MRTLFFLLCLSLLTSSLFAGDPSWQKLKTEPWKGKQDDIFFINEQTGWYVNGYGRIYRTGDGGATWQLLLEQKGSFFRCIAFIDSLTGFAGTVGTDYFPNVTDTIALYKTTDGGRSWSPCSYTGPYVKGLCALDIVTEQVVDHGNIGYRHHIYGVGRVGGPASFIVSHDGGNSFRSMDMSPYCNMLFDIRMLDKQNGFACAASSGNMPDNHARIIRTRDGGSTWQTVYESKRPFEITWKCSFPTRKTGYVTLQHYNPDSTQLQQRFVKTVNGGKSWKEMPLCRDYKARPFGVGFIDEEKGFIGTMNSGYATADGGRHWTKTDLGAACNKIRILRDPGGRLYGYAIGVNVYKLTATE
jgi:photosystem II stability/assembly factor-like uncharacterized protein